VAENRNRKNKKQMRGKSMLGTILFALGIVLLVSSVIAGSIWLGVAAVACLLPGVRMLYQVGKSVS
jgi:membrane-bound ClpP family serine protease